MNSFRILSLSMLALLLSPATGNLVSAQPGPEYETIEQQVFSLVNRQRQTQKLLPLSMKETISALCLQHSRNMAKGLLPPGHQGIEGRIRAIQSPVHVLAYFENIAVSRGYKDRARDAVAGWMKNSEQRKAIHGDYDLTGIGVAMSSDSTYYITQIFIKSR